MLLLAWLVSTNFYVLSLRNSNLRAEKHTRELRRQLFEYQVKYEDIYTHVYPASVEGRGNVERVAVPVADNVSSDSSNVQKMEQHPESSFQGSPVIALRGVHVDSKGPAAGVKFELHNLKPGTVQKGYLWAIAMFHNERGENFFEVYPKTLQVTKDSLRPLVYRAGHRFAVRNFASYDFNLAQGSRGRLMLVKFGAVDESGELLVSRSHIIHPAGLGQSH